MWPVLACSLSPFKLGKLAHPIRQLHRGTIQSEKHPLKTSKLFSLIKVRSNWSFSLVSICFHISVASVMVPLTLMYKLFEGLMDLSIWRCKSIGSNFLIPFRKELKLRAPYSLVSLFLLTKNGRASLCCFLKQKRDKWRMAHSKINLQTLTHCRDQIGLWWTWLFSCGVG